MRQPPTSCPLRLFVYEFDLVPMVSRVNKLQTRGLTHQIDSFTSPANRRAFTSEVPVLSQLLSACKRVHDPAAADAFVVGAPLGSAIVARWSVKADSRDGGHLLQHLHSSNVNRSLPYLSASTAGRHIFFCTVDSQFVYLGGGGPWAPPGVEQQSIWVHLGDDHFTNFLGPRHSPSHTPPTAHGFAIPNGLTVPYRISHWLPFGFPPPSHSKNVRVALSNEA